MKSDRLVFFVGVNTGYLTNGRPDQRYIEFYGRRSSRQLHCAIVGNVVIPGGYGTNANTPILTRAAEWKRVASAIAERGSLPGMQLATVWPGYIGQQRFRALKPNDAIEELRTVVQHIGSSFVLQMLNSLDSAASIASEAGFRHLQIHAAHGYLFNLLMDDRLYTHASEVLAWLADWASTQSSRGIETSIRISMRAGAAAFDEDGQDTYLQKVIALPFDFVDLSSGFYNVDKQLIYPSRPDVLEARRQETIRLANQFPRNRFIFSGKALLKSDTDLPSNVHFGVCRDLIANPDFLVSKDVGCSNAGKCHYYSRGRSHLVCAQWARRDALPHAN